MDFINNLAECCLPIIIVIGLFGAMELFVYIKNILPDEQHKNIKTAYKMQRKLPLSFSKKLPCSRRRKT